MMHSLGNHFTSSWLMALLKTHGLRLNGTFNTIEYSARVLIPNYRDRVREHYKDIIGSDLFAYCKNAKVPFEFIHFGIEIEFAKPIELTLHDKDMVLDSCLPQLMRITGPVILKNAYHHSTLRAAGHRNRFPHLNFHVDRNSKQPDHYSLYSRDPFDEEQKHPRTVSTLICANIVGYLQDIKEGITDRTSTKGLRATYTIFAKDNMENVLDNIVLEQKWCAPLGTGEIAMQDNLTCLHSSYYHNNAIKGYKIGVRYLA